VNTGRSPGNRRAVGALESEILTLLQSAQQALTPGEVLQHIDDSLSYSTVVTVLSRMFAKGLLIRSKLGRAYAYTPVDDTHGLAARRMRQVLEADGDREAVLTRFVEDLSAGDEQVLRQLLGGLPEKG
jgi:predicted transcriptional regulator